MHAPHIPNIPSCPPTPPSVCLACAFRDTVLFHQGFIHDPSRKFPTDKLKVLVMTILSISQ